MQVLIIFGNKVYAITLEYTLKLGSKIRFIDIKTYKINASTFNIFGIVLAYF